MKSLSINCPQLIDYASDRPTINGQSNSQKLIKGAQQKQSIDRPGRAGLHAQQELWAIQGVVQLKASQPGCNSNRH